ncbi:MAG: hypothetical protein OXH22_12115 [Chloroflexi bacterium]|nr:hypothetical protein [Chloroflexota bacterium]
MVDDTGRIDESRMWQAVERLESASQATHEEQIATNVRLDAIEKEQSAMNARLDILTLRIDRLFYAIIGGSIAVTVAVVAHGFIAN